MVSSQVRREQVALARERGLSQRRACELLEVARSALSYPSVRAECDAPALEAMKRLAEQYRATTPAGFESSCAEKACT